MAKSHQSRLEIALDMEKPDSEQAGFFIDAIREESIRTPFDKMQSILDKEPQATKPRRGEF